MPYYSDPPLQCFYSDRYTVTLSSYDRRCIAPARTGARCRWDISLDEIEDVQEFTEQAMQEPIRSVREALLEEVVLLRTCGDYHREKLEHDAACLREVAQRYDSALYAASTQPYSRRTSYDTRSSPRRSLQARRESSAMVTYSGQPRERYLTRSQLQRMQAVDPTISLPEPGSIFVPYSTPSTENIRDTLLSDVGRGQAAQGIVYAFSWPEAPDHCKIGYTAASVEARMTRWRDCHPGATVHHQIEVPYPERIEKLIHLELMAFRYKIVICKYCHGTHQEWFKASQADIAKVFSAWSHVANVRPLYENRSLTPWWRDLVANLDVPITGELLKTRVSEEINREFYEMLAKFTNVETKKKDAIPGEPVVANAGLRSDTGAETTIKESDEADSSTKESVGRKREDSVVAHNLAPAAVISEVKDKPEIVIVKVTEIEKAVPDEISPDKTVAVTPVKPKTNAKDWGAILDIFGDFMFMISDRLV